MIINCLDELKDIVCKEKSVIVTTAGNSFICVINVLDVNSNIMSIMHNGINTVVRNIKSINKVNDLYTITYVLVSTTDDFFRYVLKNITFQIC